VVIFREGLLEARGQIVFILALTVSTAVIIYLEALDTEDRIRGRIEQALVGDRPAAPAPPRSRRARPGGPAPGRGAFARNQAARRPGRALLTALAGACSSALSAGEATPAGQRPGRRGGRQERSAGLAAALGCRGGFPDLQERIAGFRALTAARPAPAAGSARCVPRKPMPAASNLRPEAGNPLHHAEPVSRRGRAYSTSSMLIG
jgi:hypothetical protein